MKERLIHVWLYSGQLPDRAVLKGDFENPGLRFIGERLDFRIKDRNRRHPKRRNQMRTVIDLRDVGMIERCQDFGFTLRPRQAFGVSRELRRQDLDGNVPLQLRIPGSINFTL